MTDSKSSEFLTSLFSLAGKVAMPDPGSRLNASDRVPGFEWSTPFSPVFTNPERATTSCCAHLPTTTLSAADEEMAAHGYRHHEFGDSMLVIPADPVSRAAEM